MLFVHCSLFLFSSLDNMLLALVTVVLSTLASSSSYDDPPPTHVTFPQPAPILKPSTYLDVFSGFQQCKAAKCTRASDDDDVHISSDIDISDAIAILGEYTSCVTGCSATQLFKTLVQYKEALGEMFAIGSSQLVATREYLTGTSEYDVIGSATRIGDSCCLPRESFSTWDQTLIPVTMVTHGHADTITHNLAQDQDTNTTEGVPRMVSVSTYLSWCSHPSSWGGNGENETEEAVHVERTEWKDNLRVICDSAWVEYLEVLRRTMGELILSPSTSTSAPVGSCNTEAVPNPLAEDFPHDICVAKTVIANGHEEPVDIPVTKSIIPANYEKHACPSDIISADSNVVFELTYERQLAGKMDFHTLTSGLPSHSGLSHENDVHEAVTAALTENNGTLGSSLDCVFDQGLSQSSGNFYTPVAPPSKAAISAAQMCPLGGTFEYCNMQQYASFLQRQLYDNGACQIVDMQHWGNDHAVSLNTLACLYKTVSMKCDCMEAVLNCYEHQFNFKDAMAGTIGKAASVLSGFLLCLRPKVYSLFGGQHALEQANIMRDLLKQVGVSVPTVSSMPPATFAFLAFGIGMVAFVATKIISKKTRQTNHDPGYALLI